MSDKYFDSVEVTLRDYNTNGEKVYLSEDHIVQLGRAIQRQRSAEQHFMRTVDRIANQYYNPLG